MKQTTKITLLIIVAIIFILVLLLFALARFFGKQLIQPCMQEGFTDSQVDNLITLYKNPASKKLAIETEKQFKWCDMLVPLYTKPGLIKRIVLKGNDWLNLRNIQIINGNNTMYNYNTDYTMDITGSPKFLSNKSKSIYDFSQMGDTFDSLFHSGTAKNVVFTITMKTPSVIKVIMIMNRFNCCWERLNSFTMYGYNADGSELFSKKLDDPALSNFRVGTRSNYEGNRQKNAAVYVISPFGYVSLFADNVCLNKVPIMDVKIADYKRIYITEYTTNSTWMMSESGEIATYSGSISNFTEDRWKNARKITIPVGYSTQTTIFPSAILPSVPTTAPPTTTPARTTATTTPAPTTATTTPAPIIATTTPAPIIATTTPAPTIATTTPAPTIATTTPAPTTATTTPAPTTATTTPAPTTATTTPAPTIATTTPAPTTTTSAIVPSSTSVTYANIDNKITSYARYSAAYNTITYNL